MDGIRLNGHLIRKAYADMGLSRTEFAHLADIPPSTLTNITSPTSRPTSRKTAAKIGRALCPQRSVEQLMLKRPEPSRPKDNRPPKSEPKPPFETPKKPAQPKKQVA